MTQKQSTISRLKAYRAQQEVKRKKHCLTDKEIESIIEQLLSEKRISMCSDDDTDQIRVNISRIFIAAAKKNPEKYIFARQLSDALSIDIRAIQSILPQSRDELIKIHGLALRNMHGVGYRIADYTDVLIETDKSIKRLGGIDFNAMKRVFESFASIANQVDPPSFHKELRNSQQNLLQMIGEALDEFERDRQSFRKNKDFNKYQTEISNDLSDPVPSI